VTESARLFVAIRFSPDVREAIVRGTGELRSGQSAVRWVRDDQIHLTLRFLGSVPRGRIGRLDTCLSRAAESMSPFDLCLDGAGCFPDTRKPRVLWIGASAPALEWTRAAVENAVVSAGFQRDARRFRPHVTIGRLRPGRAVPDGLPLAVESVRVDVRAHVDSISLVESTLLPRGARHREVRGYGFPGAATVG
jgi:2'-5' RNA ligase